MFTGQFTYDFAEGLIMTKDVTRLGLDAGNYDYSLTLDGVNDEDVRELYAYGANEIEGNVMIDARENANITLIDLAGMISPRAVSTATATSLSPTMTA